MYGPPFQQINAFHAGIGPYKVQILISIRGHTKTLEGCVDRENILSSRHVYVFMYVVKVYVYMLELWWSNVLPIDCCSSSVVCLLKSKSSFYYLVVH